MKKQILTLGKILNKKQQTYINGGKKYCDSHYDCGPNYCCNTASWCQPFGSQGSTGYLCDGSLIDL